MAGHAHHHHEHSGAKLVSEAEDVLTAAGEQWTGMRADVFEALADRIARPRPTISPRNWASARGKRVAANSVYRILDLFVRTNLANRIESANAYLANTHPGCRHDCIFLICDDCGKASHIDDDTLTDALRQSGKRHGFANVRPVVELRGLCDECAS